MMPEESRNQDKTPLKRKIFRAILGVLVFILILYLALGLLIRIPAVQNYLRNETTAYLHKKLQRDVSISRLNLEWFSKLGLDTVLIQDAALDTTLYAGHLSASIDMNIIALLRGKLAIHEIALNNVLIKDNHRNEDSIGTLNDMMQHLFPSNKNINAKNEGSALELDLKNISFQNIHFKSNAESGSVAIGIGQGQITMDTIDLTRKVFDINTISIDYPDIQLIHIKPGITTAPLDLFGDSLLSIKVKKIHVQHGKLSTAGWSTNTLMGGLLHDIQDNEIALNNINFNHEGMVMGIDDLRLVGNDGFGIHHLEAKHAGFNPSSIKLLGYQLNTKDSHLADSITLTYNSIDDFKAFNDKVLIHFNASRTSINTNDLMHLIPSLAKVDFFKKNFNKAILLEGSIIGTVNDLKSNQIKLKMANTFDFDGKADFTNLSNADETFISLHINALNTQASILKEVVPTIATLKNMDRLGNLNFKGNFDGNFKDFVAYGILKTDVGSSKLDMRLKTSKDIDQAKYSGEIELIDFDLGKYTGDNKLGKISLKATVTDGSSLRAATASAKLKSNIYKLEYNGYTYANMLFNGVLNRKLLDGNATLRDENANLDFNGKIDFTNAVPAYDFDASIHKLDFYKLKLLNTPLTISGNATMNMNGNSLEEMIGQIRMDNFIIQKDTVITLLKSLSLNASSDRPGNQKLSLQSDWIDSEISGHYALKQILPSLKNQLKTQFPEIAASVKLTVPDRSTMDTTLVQSFKYSVTVKDIRGVSNLFDQKILASKPIKIEGEVNEKAKYFLANWNIPDFRWNDLNIFNTVGRLEAKGSIAFTSTYIDSTINKNFHLPQMVFTADLSYNKMNFTIKTPTVGDVVNNVSLNGNMELIDSTYHMHFNSSQVSFLDRNWDILPDNEIAFRPGYIQTKNLRFAHGDEKLEFTSVGSKGLKVDITNLGIDWANPYFPLKEWKLSGKINLKAEVNDAFHLEGLKVAGLIDSIFINKLYFGLIDINAYTPNINQPIQITVAMLDGTKQMIGEGFYDITGKFSNGVKNNYQFKFLFKDYPLRLFEFLLDDVIDNTRGNIQGNLAIRKVNDSPDFKGKINITDGGLKVNYLGTTYTIGTQPITINNNAIDVTGVQMKDEFGNIGTLNGGLVHDHFKAFSLNAGLSSNRLLVLKTTKEQNPDYYGTLVGKVIAKFYGEFNAINIDVQGITARPSTLNIPISQATVITSDRIVSYRPRVTTAQDTIKRTRFLASKGVSVSIDLTVNSDAEIALIFDEKRGDILKGTGNGDLQMKFERSGGITMYGNYEVNQGEYLFTLLGVVNKPFKIKQGGMIRWDGDPLRAQIELDAEYKGLSSSLINLLPEYENTLGSAALRTQASIDLGMHLFGELFHPEISFNIDIPNLTGDLRSVVDNKLSLLKADQNALNQQVLGLMVWGSFLPPNQLVASSGVLGSTINNLSQFVSSQLSLLVENALKELISDNNVISGFDFDVNYYNNSNVVDLNKASVFDEYVVNLAPKFFEDRLKVDLGANFVNSALFSNLITPHFEVEYAITKDRHLKIRAYARKDDINQGQLKDRIGGGISWRKEFDSLKDFKKQLKEDLQ